MKKKNSNSLFVYLQGKSENCCISEIDDALKMIKSKLIFFNNFLLGFVQYKLPFTICFPYLFQLKNTYKSMKYQTDHK